MKKIQNSDELKSLMKKKGVVIFFFMDGCGHCEATRPAWEELSRSGIPLEFAEVESSVVSPELGIRGFPHFHLVDVPPKTCTNLWQRLSLLKKSLKQGAELRTLEMSVYLAQTEWLQKHQIERIHSLQKGQCRRLSNVRGPTLVGWLALHL
jgi:thiol-disulfide isomerase/thioredoxin